MADTISKEKRSWNMSRIRGKNTTPEITVRSLLHKMGYRFRIHRKDLPGKPDIVLPKYKTVIFVHGCFWHRHKDCKNGSYTPKSNVDSWSSKFDENEARDKRNKEQLEARGWNVEIIWECETTDQESLTHMLNSILAGGS